MLTLRFLEVPPAAPAGVAVADLLMRTWAAWLLRWTAEQGDLSQQLPPWLNAFVPLLILACLRFQLSSKTSVAVTWVTADSRRSAASVLAALCRLRRCEGPSKLVVCYLTPVLKSLRCIMRGGKDGKEWKARADGKLLLAAVVACAQAPGDWRGEGGAEGTNALAEAIPQIIPLLDDFEVPNLVRCAPPCSRVAGRRVRRRSEPPWPATS